MFSNRQFSVIAISMLAATVGLAGCGGNGGVATLPADFSSADLRTASTTDPRLPSAGARTSLPRSPPTRRASPAR